MHKVLVVFIILAVLVILLIIRFYFLQARWRKRLKAGESCDIYHGSERIHGCKIEFVLEDRIGVIDCWGYLRTLNRNDVYKPFP